MAAMTLLAEAGAARLFANPAVAPDRAYGAAETAILDPVDFDAAVRESAAWPGYAETPLIAAARLARAAGLGASHYKDESGRFGLGSFNALGGAYAVYRLLARQVAERTGAGAVSAAALAGGAHREVTSGITVCCATDGNHGRSVAWGAKTFGCRAVIYIHATVSEGRRDAIAQYGAEVVRTPGSYDNSVRRAAADAVANGWFVVSDTSYDGYTEVPRQVMQGYGVMGDEAVRQLPNDAPSSHVFLQGGVGGMAAAVCARLRQHYGARRPRFVVVEPARAACLHESARAGRPVALTGDIDTLMAGLACGEPSLVAWPLLAAAAAAFMTVPDEAAVAVMRLLADGANGDPPLVAGESAVAGLAGALFAAARPELADALGLNAESRVLVFGTEGATDPELYRELVGRDAKAVLPAAARSA